MIKYSIGFKKSIMCNRFIEDFAEKVIQQLDYDNRESKELREINIKIREILSKRCQILQDELEKEDIIGIYQIKAICRNGISIYKDGIRRFDLYCDKRNDKPFYCHITLNKQLFNKEEVIEYIVDIVDNSKEVRDAYLNKLNIIEDLEFNHWG